MPTNTRTEQDPLGTLDVPADALYGVQTLRAIQNFPISGLKPLPPFVIAQVWIKKAAALTHKATGRLDPRLADAIVAAANELLAGKGREFDDIVKAGRTHLQDAMPIRLGQEFDAYAGSIERGLKRVTEAADYLRDLGIGGSAVGTGVTVEPSYPNLMIKHLKEITGLDLRVGKDRVQLMQSMGDVAGFSSALKVLAIDLSKIASDLRLMVMGPRTGIDEIKLPAVQPGSSIMPGKVNPSIPEMVNQVCLQVIGLDTTVAVASEHGQLELNVMMPVIAFNVLLSMRILTNATTVLSDRCVKGIEANRQMCEYWVERSAALATALAPQIGYAKAAEISKQSVKENILIRDLVKREHVLPDDQIDDVLDLRKMTEIGVPGGAHGAVAAG